MFRSISEEETDKVELGQRFLRDIQAGVFHLDPTFEVGVQSGFLIVASVL